MPRRKEDLRDYIVILRKRLDLLDEIARLLKLDREELQLDRLRNSLEPGDFSLAWAETLARYDHGTARLVAKLAFQSTILPVGRLVLEVLPEVEADLWSLMERWTSPAAEAARARLLRTERTRSGQVLPVWRGARRLWLVASGRHELLQVAEESAGELMVVRGAMSVGG